MVDSSPTGLERLADTDPVALYPAALRQIANSVQAGNVTGIAVTGGNATAVSVSFDPPFMSAPIVTASVRTTGAATSSRAISVWNVTSTGCTVYYWSATTGTAQTFAWIAVGPGPKSGG